LISSEGLFILPVFIDYMLLCGYCYMHHNQKCLAWCVLGFRRIKLNRLIVISTPIRCACNKSRYKFYIPSYNYSPFVTVSLYIAECVLKGKGKGKVFHMLN